MPCTGALAWKPALYLKYVPVSVKVLQRNRTTRMVGWIDRQTDGQTHTHTQRNRYKKIYLNK